MRTLVEGTLRKLEPEIKYSENAVNLILGTIAQESEYGEVRRQCHNGPALGIAQCEPNTFNDIVKNFLKYHPDIISKIKLICHVGLLRPIDLLNNDTLAISMCRVHYLRCKGSIPDSVEGWAQYWKEYYNTPVGEGTEQEFINNYNEHVEIEV